MSRIEVRQSLVLRHVRIGAHHQDAEVGILRAGGPDLLAVDDPVVAVAARRGSQRGEVGAARRARGELAPDLFAARELGQKRVFSPRSPRHERRRGHALADAEHAARQVVLRLFLVPDHLVDRDAPRPPYSFGQVMHAQPASYLRFCHSFAASIGSSPASSFAVGTLLFSQARASSRNAASFGVSLKSMMCSLTLALLCSTA